MSNISIVGAQWGDEGKGKLVDMLSENADVIVRYQGGNNAGHTVIAEGKKYILHVVPSGILHEGKLCVIGNGVVLDPEEFLKELDALQTLGIDISPSRLKLSYKTQIIMPYHKALDHARESASGKKIGTTGRGIGPCYEDQKGRIGIRAGDFLATDTLLPKIQQALKEKNVLLTQLYGQEPLDAEEIYKSFQKIAPRIVKYLADTTSIILDAAKAGKQILFEGAQGVMLDIDHGTYPFVTSSNVVCDNAAIGAGIPATLIDKRVAIVKAYTTRVGAGPFPTELFDGDGEKLRKTGMEFGATTGRPRRCGWLDLTILRDVVRMCAPSCIALTKIDVLSGFKTLKICTGYELEGKTYDYPPQFPNALEKVTPIYEELPGWNEDLAGCSSWELLPSACRSYILRIEEILGVKIEYISVGPDRKQTFTR